MYTQEQNREIEKVMNAFADYIRDTPHFDLLWSDKVGYVFLDGISEEQDDFCMAPIILRDGETLCEEIIYHIACDVVEEKGKSHDLRLCGTEEREEIQKRLLPSLRQLPEYEHLVEELFED